MWAALASVQSAVVFTTPSFFNHYPGFVAPAAALVLGTGMAVWVGGMARLGLPPMQGRAAIVLPLGLLAAVSLLRREGQALPLADVEQDISHARCVSADSPVLLVLTSPLHRNLEARCPLVLDPHRAVIRHGPRSLAPGVSGQRASTGARVPACDARVVHERGRGSVLSTAR